MDFETAIESYRRHCNKHGVTFEQPSALHSTLEDGHWVLANVNGVLFEMRTGPSGVDTAPSKTETGIEQELELRRLLLQHVIANLNEQLIEVASDGLRELLSDVPEIAGELLGPLFEHSEFWPHAMAKEALGIEMDDEFGTAELLERFENPRDYPDGSGNTGRRSMRTQQLVWPSDEFLTDLAEFEAEAVVTRTDTPVAKKKEDPALITRRHYAEWLAYGIRYEIDFSVGEDGVAIEVPIDAPTSMAQWLDEWTGVFHSAGGWATHGDHAEIAGGPEFVEAIRQGEIAGPSPQELEAAIQKVQAERELTEQLKAKANLAYESNPQVRFSDINREVIHDDHLNLTEDEEMAVKFLPSWERQLFWASRIDPKRLYGFRRTIVHGRDVIGMLERWAGQEFAKENQVDVQASSPEEEA